MRRLLTISLLALAAVAVVAWPAGAQSEVKTYEIEMYNAFGIVEGSDVRIAGVNAGTVTTLDINEKKRAVVTVELSGPLSTLGVDSQCASEPQSLIAEYFLDCTPKGEPIDPDEQNPDIPASQVSQTVQPDLAQSMFRAPYVDRFQVLINEFGTALAGNPENLNEAIRLGAPALTETQKVTSILARQNTTIRDLNVNSDRIIGRLNDNRADVVRFVREAADLSQASEERGEELQQNFDRLDDFLAELDPTLVELGNLAREQEPLLTDLRASAPGLNELAVDLPDFNAATSVSLDSLGEASQVGEVALRRGRDEIRQLSDTARNAGYDAELLGDLLRDLDDPGRATEEDKRAWRTCNDKSKPCYSTGRRGGGYTGLEGLLNYAYYQTLTTNQFDEVGHLLHIAIYSIGTGPCGGYVSGYDDDGDPAFPTDAAGPPGATAPVGGRSGEDIFTSGDLANCAAWLGPNQPGVTEDINLPPYDPAVCPDGVAPGAEQYCNPSGGRRASGEDVANRSGDGSGGTGLGEDGGGDGDGDGLPDVPNAPELPDENLQDLLPQGPGNGGSGGNGGGGGGGNLGDLGNLPNDLLNRGDRGGRGGNGGGGNGGGGGGRGAQQLLDYLFQN